MSGTAPNPDSATSTRQALRGYVDYLRDMGVHDLYRRDDPTLLLSEELRRALTATAPAVQVKPKAAGAASPVVPMAVPPLRLKPTPTSTSSASPAYFAEQAEASPLSPELLSPMPKPPSFDSLLPLPGDVVASAERAAALVALQLEIGDCTRCPLAYAGRHKIVFGDGTPTARLMFVGEGPGADEDARGLPFVGKAGQLLNNMITAMGLKREEVYIANIVKCRPPANRAPEFIEATTCSQFLARQTDIVRPEVIVALGKTAANYLLGNVNSITSMRGQWFGVRGSKVAVTYHPAYLLRDPKQKSEAWKDLQRVMVEMGLKAPARVS